MENLRPWGDGLGHGEGDPGSATDAPDTERCYLVLMPGEDKECYRELW
jgi:hypothetical protein